MEKGKQGTESKTLVFVVDLINEEEIKMEYQQRDENIKFETIKSQEVKFGRNNFIEIARKKAVTTQGDANEFIAISRGFFGRDGMKRFKRSLTIPDDVDVIDFICKNVKEMSSGKKASTEDLAETE